MTSFFGVVTGNPFSTPVGSKIEQATDASLASENWALNMEICDLINETDDGPKDAIKAIRKRLLQAVGKNYTIVMFTLTVLETCVKNCGKRFHVLICNKEFVNELVRLIGPKNEPPPAVQEKVLFLIQSWVDAFHRHQDLNGVVQVYNELKAKGVEFPMTDLDSMAPIHTPKKSVAMPSAVMDLPAKVPPATPPSSGAGFVGGGNGSTIVGPVTSLTPEQLSKLHSDLDILQTNMAVFGDMLNEMSSPLTEQPPSDITLFHDLHATLVVMQERLVELLSQLSSDEMTADLLRINDHLNNLFLRYSRYEKNHRGMVPETKANVADSLIDLSDEASGRATSSLTKQMESIGLGSQLAKIGSVPAQTKTDNDETDFDMFAQSRKLTYESSKTGGSTYESNSISEVTGGNLGVAVESRAAGTVPSSGPPSTVGTMHKESDFDEMAKWLAEGGSGAGGEESLTSSEFEKFLAERAAAAETLPTTGPSSKQRADRRGGGGAGPTGSSGGSSLFAL